MYEILLLKALLNRNNYQYFRNYLSFSDFPPELRPVLAALDELQKGGTTNPTVHDIGNVVYARGLSENEQPFVKAALDTMQQTGGEESAHRLLERVKHKAISQQLAVAAVNFVEGRGHLDKMLELADKLRAPIEDQQDDIVTDDLEEILHTSVSKPGLRWRLNCLNHSLGSLRKGNFGFIYARPEVGKSSLLASEITQMAGQLNPETDGPILWFCNEEPGYIIKLRQYQAALGATLTQLKSAPKRAQEAFKRATGGMIRLVDRPVLTKEEIASKAVLMRPSLIVVDQLDKVHGFENDRKDLQLGDIYQWSRELAKQHCPVIGVCQADGTAEGQRYLTMAHIANSKTSKAAEADWIIGIGKDNGPGYDYIRFLNILKNKLVGDEDTDPKLRHAQFEVRIKPEIARYEDL